jgi:hypothetical protein
MAKETKTMMPSATGTGTTGLTRGNDPTGGTTGQENVVNDPTGGTTIPTGVVTARLNDSSFESDKGIKMTGRTAIINYIIGLCGFAEDSIMVEYIDQEEWSKIHHVTSIGIHEVKDFHTIKDNGSYEAKPLTIYLRLFKGFLLYYRRRCNDFSMTLDKHDVMNLITKKPFESYMIVSNMATATEGLTVPEFHRGTKRDKTHYEDLKDDKFFNTWNRGFVATACMHQTDLVVSETYVPKTDAEKEFFKEMQTLIYAVLEDHLKTDKGKSLVSHYELSRDAQSIYSELKKYAVNSTAAQLPGDKLLQYIKSARFPGSWRGTSYGFVLHMEGTDYKI